MKMGSSSTDGGAGSSSDDDIDNIDSVDNLREQVLELKRQLSQLRDENRELKRSMERSGCCCSSSSSRRCNKELARTSGASSATAAAEKTQEEEEDLEEEDGERTRSSLRPSLPDLRPSSSSSSSQYESPLTNDEIERYSRQVLAGLGVHGQQLLLKARVVVVGAGGIGSSCLLYLAGCGIGHLTVIDHDHVEMSNLHRQVIHTTQTCGTSKAKSAQRAVLALNPTIECTALDATLTHDNALELLETYEIIVDATDNPQTRYLINDAAVLLAKTRRATISVVFASAVATEAQITVFTHFGSDDDNDKDKYDGCYRCLYPDPVGSVAARCASCSDAGVVGTVPGLVGVLQATQVLQIVTGTTMGTPLYGHVLHYDAVNCRFLKVRKPPRRPDCAACGQGSKITSMSDSWDSLRGARGPATLSLSCPAPSVGVRNVSPLEYYPVWRQSYKSHDRHEQQIQPHLLLDVRDEIQYELCHLPGSVNVPLRQLPQRLDDVREWVREAAIAAAHGGASADDDDDNHNNHKAGADGGAVRIFCLCRRGIASAAAAELLASTPWSAVATESSSTQQSRAADDHPEDSRGALPLPRVEVWNVRGGLDAWRVQVDPSFPNY